jgi:hypothetical protein
MRFLQTNNFIFWFGKELKAQRTEKAMILYKQQFQLLVWQGFEGALRRH